MHTLNIVSCLYRRIKIAFNLFRVLIAFRSCLFGVCVLAGGCVRSCVRACVRARAHVCVCVCVSECVGGGGMRACVRVSV